jgi:hypothetical protein
MQGTARNLPYASAHQAVQVAVRAPPIQDQLRRSTTSPDDQQPGGLVRRICISYAAFPKASR